MSPVRWLRAVAVIVATALLMASSCSWQTGIPIPDGVPPPAGAPVPEVDTHAAGRPADQLHAWAAARAPALGIPAPALEAYAYAARVAQVENPTCNLAWTTLAGIGMVESHHGTYRGATVASNGDVRPPIRGVQLDGTMGNLKIADTDGGKLDGDATMDRAMGPMQFIPETWRLYGVDANNDGVISPDNFDDAALSAAGYLCWRGKDLSTPRGWMDALRAYNLSDQYARTVRDWATSYAAGHPL
ncbi:lytic transglycosylase domain-containing protein [Mycobacterium sp. BMJ-28]